MPTSDRFGKIKRENLFLTSLNSENTCTIGLNRDLPWTMALYESDSLNNSKLLNKIGNTFSHEIIENTLVDKYKLSDYKFRWFRDGMSEYIAYNFCLEVVPVEAERYFIKNRLSDAYKFCKNGNLLDWRGDSPIALVDTGKLYGGRFIYFNDVGQYGRAFKLFKDLFDDHQDYLPKILEMIDGVQNIDLVHLLEIMKDVTGRDIIKLIGKY